MGNRPSVVGQWRARWSQDSGQSMVLAIGLTAVTLLVISAVMAAAAVNLKARQLLALADSAVVAAVDEFEFHTDEQGAQLVLSGNQVEQAASTYLSDVHAEDRFAGLHIKSVVLSSDRQGATLHLGASVSPPIVGWIIPDGIPISVASSARSILSR